jgi:hypothetical protein
MGDWIRALHWGQLLLLLIGLALLWGAAAIGVAFSYDEATSREFEATTAAVRYWKYRAAGEVNVDTASPLNTYFREQLSAESRDSVRIARNVARMIELGAEDWRIRNYLRDVEGFRPPEQRGWRNIAWAFASVLVILPLLGFAVLWVWFGGRRARAA